MSRLSAALSSVILASAASEPVRLVIDTDIGGGGCRDVDDVGAMVVGHALMDNGEATLLAVVVNSGPERCPGVVSVLNRYYGRDDVPIGSYKGSDVCKGCVAKYVDDVAEHWDSPIKNASQVPSGVEVYRKVLAAQPDRSVAISSIGLMTNLRDLLRSGGDKYSPLTGTELVAKKVKLLAAMAGWYPRGIECNMMGGIRPSWRWLRDHHAGTSASAFVYSNWPSSVPIIFSGFEVGIRVLTGAPLAHCTPEGHPARQAYIDFLGGAGKTRPSWDPLTTLIAVRGVAAGGCRQCVNCDGKNHINRITGGNRWVRGAPSNPTYIKLEDAATARAAIDALMCQVPVNRSAASKSAHALV